MMQGVPHRDLRACVLHRLRASRAAPAWRRSEPLPAPSAFTPYASGNKAVVGAHPDTVSGKSVVALAKRGRIYI